METVVIADGKYRASIAAARTLGRGGYRVVAVQAREDCPLTPPVFTSRFVSEGRWLPGSASGPEYPARLRALLEEYPRPVLFCAGAASLNAVARDRERFGEVCDLLVAPPEVLDALNDKETVHRRCLELGIPVPQEFQREPDAFPVVIKPHCGEKFGLKARERYAVARDREEYLLRLEAMRQYDPDPIVQRKVEGDGTGSSLLLDREGRLVCALCHRRVREYPMSGGPSTCCESFFDPDLIERAYRLLHSFGFTGMAMVEFKGPYLLEVNPRVWGSFPLTECAGSPFALRYAQAARGERLDYLPGDFRPGVRMRFLLNDGVAMLDHLRHGDPKGFLQGAADFFHAKEALASREDPKPFRRYLRNTLLRR